jgi:hypothetical protein
MRAPHHWQAVFCALHHISMKLPEISEKSRDPCRAVADQRNRARLYGAASIGGFSPAIRFVTSRALPQAMVQP